MIKFPQWMCSREDPEAGSMRLRYLIMRTAVEATQNGSIKALAEHCDVPRLNIMMAIKEGRMSGPLAGAIEKKCGRKTVRREWLICPTDIEEMVDA